jgi:nitrite reductase/ring-hydroxylating ferredoxin subunit
MLRDPGSLSPAGGEPGESAISEVSAVSEGFVAVGRRGDLAPGEMKFVAVDRERVVLANIDGTFYALRDVCGHRNAPLSRGKLIGCLIECPLHFAQFDMRTGKLVDGPVSADLAVYEVRTEDDVIYVKR